MNNRFVHGFNFVNYQKLNFTDGCCINFIFPSMCNNIFTARRRIIRGLTNINKKIRRSTAQNSTHKQQ